MKRCHISSTISGLSFCLLLLNSIFAPSAQAGRPVLNQTPQTINRYFGGYKTRLTTNQGVTYTYAPAKFKRLFPKFPKSKFSITFVNNRARKITLDFSEDLNNSRRVDYRYNYEQADATKFYNYIFGYQPSIWKELSNRFEQDTVHNFEYCLGDGVGNSFIKMGANQVTFDASFYYDSRCEPPY
ncbi:MAG TPA: hypothetical protein V6D15_00600 [Oculatellaceae cyanobacterium]